MEISPAAASASDGAGDERRKIIDAAVRCFERYGPQRSSMSDIAEEAGISRRTLYRVFDDRGTLIEEILHGRIIDLGHTVRVRLEAYATLEEALVEGSLVSVKIAEQDELFSEIVTHEQDHSVERFLLRVNDSIRASVLAAWSPLLERGRAEKRIRADLADARVVELIMMVQAIVLMRNDLSGDDQRRLLRDLLVPAVLCDQTAST